MGHALPLAYAALTWFLGTGAVLWLDRRGDAVRKLALGLGLMAGLIALWALQVTAAGRTPTAAFVAFTAAVFIWGLHELSFLTGLVTGPNAAPCPPGARGWTRFRLATLTLIHHEIALALTLTVIVALTWGGVNPAGALTFALLFVMRLSAKLNLYIGMRHADLSMLPRPLGYLATYFGRARVNPLFPQSVVLALALAYLAGRGALTTPEAVRQTGYTLIFGLTLLGLAEHLFLALPVRDSRLWRWAMPGDAPANPPLGATLETLGRGGR